MIKVPQYRWQPISLDEGLMLRAFAILAILAHNYLHWIEGSPGENEFDYQAHRARDFLSSLWHQPMDLIRWLATYFGHYGVQVFLFLSGYGLAIQHERRSLSWWEFQKRRWANLMPAVLITAFGFVLYEGLRVGWQEVMYHHGWQMLRQIVGVSNFIPENVYRPIGPWWFISVILQFYLVAPWLLKLLKKRGCLVALMVLSLAGEYLAAPYMRDSFRLNWNHTVFGHLDVCIAGMLVAQLGKCTISWAWIIFAKLVFFIGSFSVWLWPFTGIASLLAFLPALRRWQARSDASPRVNTVMRWFGGLSLYVFLCNGYLRKPLVDWVNLDPHWWKNLWTFAAFFGIVLTWSVMLRNVEHRVRKAVKLRASKRL